MRYKNTLQRAVAFSSLLMSMMGINIATAQVESSQTASTSHSLQGTWRMHTAYEILANGSRVTTYTEHPHGMLMIDHDGYYSLQIFHPKRRRLDNGKAAASLDELRDAVIGSSTHFGKISIDHEKKQLIFQIEVASFANWNGSTQIRDFQLNHGLLSYQVPSNASPNGTIAHSVWKRVQ
jgi:hypothetical protein